MVFYFFRYLDIILILKNLKKDGLLTIDEYALLATNLWMFFYNQYICLNILFIVFLFYLKKFYEIFDIKIFY